MPPLNSPSFIAFSIARREAQVLLLAERERDPDRVELRDRRERLRVDGPTRSPSCAFATPAIPSTGERISVKPRSIFAFSTAACGGLDRRGPGALALERVVVLLLADRAFGDQRRVARHVQPLALEIRAAPSRARLRRLARAAWNGRRIDPEQQLALLDELALVVLPRDQVAGNLRADLGIDRALGRAEPLGHHREVARLDGRDHDLGRRGRRRRLLAPDQGGTTAAAANIPTRRSTRAMAPPSGTPRGCANCISIPSETRCGLHAICALA